MSEPKVSVIIPTLNNSATLEKCLVSVRTNKTKHNYEVIVVDAGSNDDTVTIAERYADRVLDGTPFRINRNRGVEEAKGEIICFTDSDCIVPEGWIDWLVEGLFRLSNTDNRVVGVGGGNVPLLENPSIEELAISKIMRSPFVSYKARNTAVYQNEREVEHNPPVNSAYFKWIIVETGGFQEEPGYPEDLDLDTRLIRQGYKLYYMTGLLVQHKHKSSYKEFARQMEDFGKKRIRINRKYSDISRFYHYGPLILCLLLYSPFLFIPLMMGLLNSFYISTRERNYQLLFPVLRLTLSFYRNYGIGEFKVLFEKK